MAGVALTAESLSSLENREDREDREVAWYSGTARW
jgi:hypothetical protein